MNIAENILKHSLQNVYFLVGTACGGKTAMARAISKKYGFIHFNDNWNEDFTDCIKSLKNPAEKFETQSFLCYEKRKKHN